MLTFLCSVWGMVPEKYVLGRVACRLTGARRFTAVR